MEIRQTAGRGIEIIGKEFRKRKALVSRNQKVTLGEDKHEVISKEIFLKKACDLLFKKKYVKGGFLESVLHREEISSSVLGRGMAVPHSVSDYALHPAVVVIKTDHRIEWGGGEVDVIFLLALKLAEKKGLSAKWKHKVPSE